MTVRVIYKNKVLTDNINIDTIIHFLEKNGYNIKACYVYTFKDKSIFVIWVVEHKGNLFYFGKRVGECEFCDDVIYRLHTEPDYNVLSYFLINYSLTVDEIKKLTIGYSNKTIYTINENYITLF